MSTEPNPYAPPVAVVADVGASSNLVYAGFWIRVAASLIDSILIVAVTWPLLYLAYGMSYFDDNKSTGLMAGPLDALISYGLPAAATIAFWVLRRATPGKMIFGARVVDARTGKPLSVGQGIGRYLGYFVSTIVFGLGFFWVAFDRRKQGWHDKIAGTVVVREKRGDEGGVTFEDA